MEDDNTIKLTKGSSETSSSYSSSDGSLTTPQLSTLFQSSKELASLSSSANFRDVSSSSDLKNLLPKRKMEWMTLDKFGRRVQRMEDDGTVNMKKEPTTRSESDVEMSAEQGTAPPLNKLLQNSKELSGYEASERNFREINQSADLKALLPKRKMTWMKLDKLGRRVERMEDDGTVNKLRGRDDYDTSDESAAAAEEIEVESGGFKYEEAVAVENMLPDLEETIDGSEDYLDDGEARVESDKVDPNEQFLSELLKVGDSPEPASSSNLKDLLPKKPTWTKLDFKGVGVEDDRRTKKAKVSDSATDSGLKHLLLQNKKPTWTKLDFKGGVVEDESRTTKSSSSEDFNKGQYTNLKTLLPERKIGWGTRGKVVSNKDDEGKGQSLKTLLPERKIMWRNKEIRGGKS